MNPLSERRLAALAKLHNRSNAKLPLAQRITLLESEIAALKAQEETK